MGGLHSYLLSRDLSMAHLTRSLNPARPRPEHIPSSCACVIFAKEKGYFLHNFQQTSSQGRTGPSHLDSHHPSGTGVLGRLLANSGPTSGQLHFIPGGTSQRGVVRLRRSVSGHGLAMVWPWLGHGLATAWPWPGHGWQVFASGHGSQVSCMQLVL